MKIYMIRHGETDWNRKRKLQGQVDIPLNEFGKLLAKETAPALAFTNEGSATAAWLTYQRN